MKKALIVIVVVFLVLCGGGGWFAMQALKAKNAGPPKDGTATVEKGDVVNQVVETGTIDAVLSVEVKSRVSGRLAKLYVDEGDIVKAGDLIAVIDPKETQLQVDQTKAQLRGAESGVARSSIEIEQRRISANASYKQAQAQLEQVRQELKIQPTLTKSSVAQAQSSLTSAKKELQRLITSVQPNELTAAQTAKREADANYANANADYERQLELEKKGYVAKKAVENAKLGLDLAQARLESATANLSRVASQQKLEVQKAEEDVKRLQAQLDQAMANRIQDSVKRSQYEAALASVEQARAALRDVEALQKGKEQSMASVAQLSSVVGNSMRELGETEIRAPISGVVTQKLVQEGELVASLSGFSSGTPVVRIEVRDAMRVKLNINEIDVAKLAVGMPAEVTVDALSDRTLKGRVSKIAPASTATGQTAAAAAAGADPVVKYSVEVRLTENEPRLKSGMSAKCSMETLSRKDVLRLPTDFVGTEGKDRFVMLAPDPKNPKAKPTRQVVTVGASSGAFIELTGGVKVGQKVVKPEYKGPTRKGAMQFGPDREEEAPAEGSKK
jgi:HlyD family secretion protein